MASSVSDFPKCSPEALKLANEAGLENLGDLNLSLTLLKANTLNRMI